MLVASCLFFGDVFFRRVQVNVAWVPPLAGRARDWLLRRQPKPVAPEFIQRLRGKKAEVTEQIEQMRGAVRFEMPQAQKPADLTVLEEPPAADKSAKPAEKPSITTPQKTEAETYTERLLRAKRKSGRTAIKNKIPCKPLAVSQCNMDDIRILFNQL